MIAGLRAGQVLQLLTFLLSHARISERRLSFIFSSSPNALYELESACVSSRVAMSRGLVIKRDSRNSCQRGRDACGDDREKIGEGRGRGAVGSKNRDPETNVARRRQC